MIDLSNPMIKNKLKDFFNDPINQKSLKEKNFNDLYENWGLNKNQLTQILINAKINFLNYLSYLPEHCFWHVSFDTDLSTLKIPSNIKALDPMSLANLDSSITSISLPYLLWIGDNIFMYDNNIEEIFFASTIGDWNSIIRNLDKGHLSDYKTKVICTNGIIQY